MSDTDLREAERQYQAEPSAENAFRLCRLLLRMGLPGEATRYCSPGRFHYETTSISSLGLNHVGLTFSQQLGGVPIVLITAGSYYTLGPQAVNQLAAENGVRSSSINRQINSNLRADDQTIRLPLNDFYAIYQERFDCRLTQLLRYWEKNPEDPISAGLAADTYLQLQNPPKTSAPIRVISQGPKNNMVAMGTFDVLISYTTPVAAINNITNQCFYINARSQTTAVHISQFLQDHNIAQLKLSGGLKRFDCLEVSGELLKAIFS